MYSGELAPLYNLIATVASETLLADNSNNIDPVAAGEKLAAVTQSAKVQNISTATQQASSLLPDSENDPSPPSDSPAIVNLAFSDYAEFEKRQGAALTPILSTIAKEIKGINVHYNQNQALYEQALQVVEGKNSPLPDLWELATSDTTIAGQWFEQIAST